MLLTISLLAPLVGPLLLGRLGGAARIAAALDGFVLVALGGLVCLHALPQSVAALGWPALLAAVCGLALPRLLHRPHAAGCGGGGERVNWVGALAALALLAHAVADGVGLVAPDALAGELHHGHAHVHGHGHGHGHAWLPWAVALHRGVEGTGLWWLLRDQPAWRRWGALVTLAAATWVGHAAGAVAAAHGLGPAVALLQASVAGSLAHVLLWHAPVAPRGSEASAAIPAASAAAASGVGGTLAAALLAGLSWSEAAPGRRFGEVWAGLGAAHEVRQVAAVGLCTSAALMVAALLHARAGAAFVRQAPGRAAPGRRRAREAVAGALAGLTQASCSCGVWPLAEGLRRRGAAPAFVSAFVAAAPAMGLVAAALSLFMLGLELTLLRALGAVALAMGAGLAAPQALGAEVAGRDAVARFADSAERGPGGEAAPCAEAGCGRRASLASRLGDGVAFAGGEVLDFTAPWLLAGLAGAWLCAQALAPEVLPTLARSGLQAAVLALVGAPLYLCAAASTLLAATLLGKGASAGGALAFLWSSSSLSPALLAAWRSQGRTTGSARFVGVVLVGAAGCGTLVDAVLPRWRPSPTVGLPSGPLVLLGSGLALALGLRALWRRGVRGAASQLARPNRAGPPSHHHAHR